MSVLPARSSGVLDSPVGDGVVAFDLVTETLHLLNGSAGAVLRACDGVTDIDDAVDRWADQMRADRAAIAADVHSALDEFRSLALIGRSEEWTPPAPPVGCVGPSAPGSVSGAVHSVLEHRIMFRSTDPTVVAAIDERLAGTSPGAVVRAGLAEPSGPPLVLEVHTDPGGIELRQGTDGDAERFSDVASLLTALWATLNRYATWTHGFVTFHAGAVRAPTGEVVVLAAPSESGKSTLTAALVAAGWDYLGDEAIGVRAESLVAVGYPKRLSLGPASRALWGLGPEVGDDVDPVELRADVQRLSGDVGAATRVILPRHVEGAPCESEPLTASDATVELLANTFNLARVGQSGLDTITALAETVPVERLTYGDANDAVAFLFTPPRT